MALAWTYAPTMKLSYETLARGHIDNHLAPYFGSRDLREIQEADLLEFVRAKLDEGLAPKTVRNALSIVRRVFNLLQREGRATRNPVTRIGEIFRQVDRRAATEVSTIDSWTWEEVASLLGVAGEHDPTARLAPTHSPETKTPSA